MTHKPETAPPHKLPQGGIPRQVVYHTLTLPLNHNCYVLFLGALKEEYVLLDMQESQFILMFHCNLDGGQMNYKIVWIGSSQARENIPYLYNFTMRIRVRTKTKL